jgi:hypothetical protein
MSFTKWFRSESLRSPKKVGLHVALLIISIAIPFTAAKAQHDQNPATLRQILAEIAAGRQVEPRVNLTLQVGFFDGGPALYITPEVGVDPNAPASVIATAKQVAVNFNANFIPQNFGILPGSTAVDDIFVFSNFHQGNVLASSPHPAGPNNEDTNYTPLWQISLVSWNTPTQARVLTSQQQILDAESSGEVTIEKTPIIVECSVIFTPGGGQLPGSQITLDHPDGRGR